MQKIFIFFFFFIPFLIQAEVIKPSYLNDLEKEGYCVIFSLFSDEEAKILYKRVFHEFIEKAWPKCQLNERTNWKETFPMHNSMGIFAGRAGQTQVMWDLRQDYRIINIFKNIWNTQDLIVSMDGLSLMCPQEIREGFIKPWPHVDQSISTKLNNVKQYNNPPPGFISESLLITNPYTIQGQFLFEDSFEGDGGFYCIPGSHLRFAEFAPLLEKISAMNIPNEEKYALKQQFLDDFFSDKTKKISYCKQHIKAPRGSLILWDSRTLHWNQHAERERALEENAKVRMVGYICYVPKQRLTPEGKILRQEAFEKGVSTGHNPAFPELKYSKDHIYPEFEKYLEDSSYVKPHIHLTPLGKSLLGF